MSWEIIVGVLGVCLLGFGVWRKMNQKKEEN